MMKTLLLSVFFLLSVVGYGQRAATISSPDHTAQMKPRLSDKMVTDTLEPPALFETCAASVTSFRIDTTGGQDGFAVGSNTLFDILKVQRFIYDSDAPFAVTEVGVAFAAYDQGIRGRTVSIELYDNLGPDSIIGSPLAVSDSIRLEDINLPDEFIRYTAFTFPETVILPSDTFLVAVNFEDTYANFTNADSVGFAGIFHTLPGCNDPGVSNFETYFDNNQNYVTAPLVENYANFDIELVMYAVVTTDLSSSNREPLADYGATLFPNPTNETAHLRFQASVPGTYTGTVTDLSGREVLRKTLPRSAGEMQIDWPVRDLAGGMYFFHIQGPEGRQTGKMIIN